MLQDLPKERREEDRFGFTRYSDQLSQEIIEDKTAGYVVGIFGGWGSGKTTFMKFMVENLIGEGFPIVWFNAWQYDKKEDLMFALVEEIKEQGKEYTRNSQQYVDTMKNVLLSAAKVSAAAVAPMTGGLMNPAVVEQIGAAIRDNNTKMNHLNSFRSDFQKAIGIITKGKNLVIFLDDLDRCLPQNIIEILETLKLFMNEANCVFVVGIDRTVAEQAVVNMYGGPLANRGRQYLEKIVPKQFNIPSVGNDKLNSIHSDNFMAMDLVQVSQAVVLAAANRNPRRCLRVINALEPLVAQFTPKGAKEQTRLVFVTCLQVCFPEFCADAVEHPDSVGEAIPILLGTNMTTKPNAEAFFNTKTTAFIKYMDDSLLLQFLRACGEIEKMVPPWIGSPSLKELFYTLAK